MLRTSDSFPMMPWMNITRGSSMAEMARAIPSAASMVTAIAATLTLTLAATPRAAAALDDGEYPSASAAQPEEIARDESTQPAASLPASFANYASILDEDSIRAADDLSEAFRRVSTLVKPSVVRVVGYNTEGEVTGSGFVIDPEGYLVTNNHVIEPAERIYVEFSDQRRFTAEVVGTDPLTDVAVLRIDSKNGSPFEALRFAERDDLKVGEWVVAVGSPLGLAQTVTAGIVSATGRRLGIIIGSGNRAGYEDFIQTDAAINRGNSGGPLLNLRGEVVGVNSAIVSRTGGWDGLGFAIPASIAVEIVEELREHGEVKRGLLGVNIQDLTPALARSYGLPKSQKGVLITNINERLPAGQVGLEVEDIITAVNDVRVNDAEHLRNVVARHKPGTEVRVDVLRDGETESFRVVLASLDEEGDAQPIRQRRSREDEGLGVDIANARLRGTRQYVAYVDAVLPGGPAGLAGFEKGDMVLEINGQSVQRLAANAGASPAEYLTRRLERASSGDVFRFKVRRRPGGGNTIVFVGLEIP